MSKFNSLATPVVYLNLDESISRRKIISEIGQREFGSNFMRFPAINAKKLESEDDPNHVRFMSTISLLTQVRIKLNSRCSDQEIDRVGVIGCSLSHCFAWLFFANIENKDDYRYFTTEENYNSVKDAFSGIDSDYLIVFEDDVILPVNAASIIQKQIDEYNVTYGDNWDVFMLGYRGKDIQNVNGPEEGFSDVLFNPYKKVDICNNDYCSLRVYHGQHAYVIKRSAVEKIMNQGFFPIEQHIDSFLGMLAQKDVLNIVGVNPKKIEFLPNDYEKSTIEHGKLLYFNYITNLIFKDYYYYYVTVSVVMLTILLIGMVYIVTKSKLFKR